ncbi:hypothetical protein Gohar_000706 [Gossypium harknessii]|uniref:Cytochrome b5 heme-binding domain-containing protein n=1 Tax=Gossypium harknessii TaxID=34285 RepID=A0A7J9I1I7_9ROSI|nr:hypothetical protein [Gossypium harknessii]
MPTLTKLYTMQEASQHNTKDDCWIVIDGKVYDVTSYLDEHPGGDDVNNESPKWPAANNLLEGKDATDDFEDAGHSKSAKELLQSFCIGELDTSSPIIPELEISSKREAVKYSEKLMDLTKQYWTIPVAIVGISVLVGFLYLHKK